MEANQRDLRIYVAGHTGMVGSAICRKLSQHGYSTVRPNSRVDLRDQKQTMDLFSQLKPDWVFLAAAKVGGIYANMTYPAEFIYDNSMIQSNVIHASYVHKVKKLLFLGSSCIYPKDAPQPFKEEHFLCGYLEKSNEPYAVSKIAGIIMCQSYNRQYGTNFISIMPANLYGPEDRFNLANSHVLPAILRKIHEGKRTGAEEVEIWGTGTPRREFLYVDDLADACLFLMNNYNSSEIINVGAGDDVTIKEIAYLIKDVAGYEGQFKFNVDMPDGMARKLLDSSRLTNIGWKPSVPLRKGLELTYKWFLENEWRIK
ncbi:MAG: GDP-L-fucose synthase [Desulfomonile tiedjei]|uniref:GDP-L-fucose synthase n=1 Tax=Desulfomonile tiedjei TaxID=2358 RepID=A0A9D6V5P1_9BACT|nr:GDP-L-fucose synthase [Desulfomonile tiedjei]